MADIRGGMTRNNSVSIPTSLGFNLASLGVPSGWRMLSGDAAQDPAWPNVYHSVDIISPWAVGRYGTIATADDFRRNKTEPDLAEAKRIGVDYMPVIFPGFSWHNLAITRGQSQYATNQIPRDCGRFYWHQFFNAIDAGSSMVFTAMFDEVDEGTAIFKTVPSQTNLLSAPPFLSLDAEGCSLPSDWYLRLAGRGTEMLRGDIQRSPVLPLNIPISGRTDQVDRSRQLRTGGLLPF
jgi:hypothetical protein